MDPRATKLAKVLVEHSVKVTKGSNVMISVSDLSALDLTQECYRLALEKGANVYLDVMGMNYTIGRADTGGFMVTFLKTASKKQLTTPPALMQQKIDWADKFIRITNIHSRNFLAAVDPKKVSLWSKTYYPIFEQILKKDWVLTYFPTAGYAQNAKMSVEEFTDFYYKAALVDYKKQGARIKKLQDILDKGKEVRIVGEGTDLTLGITGRLAAGEESGVHNVPDGEVFLAPVEDRTEGYITFDLPQNRMGNEVTGARFEFQKGKVVKYSATSGEKFLKSVMEEDPGNKRLGELGIGMNPMITNYMKDILFDEKIFGTIHLAFGSAYSSKRGGGKNKGSIHWDMIKDLRHKGSEVTVDGKVVMRDGKVLM